MSNFLIENIIGETKEDFLHKLVLMYNKNKSVLTLIEKFNLQWTCHSLDEKMNTDEIINYLKKYKNMGTPKKYKNEVEETPFRSFTKFENKGDFIQGKLVDKQPIKGSEGKINICYVILDEEDNVEKFLPSNAQLSNKLSNLEKIKKIEVGKDNSIDVYIEFTGKTKIEGTAKELSNFKVLTT